MYIYIYAYICIYININTYTGSSTSSAKPSGATCDKRERVQVKQIDPLYIYTYINMRIHTYIVKHI